MKAGLFREPLGSEKATPGLRLANSLRLQLLRIHIEFAPGLWQIECYSNAVFVLIARNLRND